MTEIRDKVRERVATIIRYSLKNLILISDDDKEKLLQSADEILSIPELAIVDREAKLPEVEGKYGSMTATSCRNAQIDMLNAGWVKEIKDTPDTN